MVPRPERTPDELRRARDRVEELAGRPLSEIIERLVPLDLPAVAGEAACRRCGGRHRAPIGSRLDWLAETFLLADADTPRKGRS